jgi:hypothetical protein
MRIIGVLGITAVLVGFIVVLLKIAHNRSFGWLIRRQLLTLSVSVYVFALTPLDTIVVRYNVHRILEVTSRQAFKSVCIQSIRKAWLYFDRY